MHCICHHSQKEGKIEKKANIGYENRKLLNSENIYRSDFSGTKIGLSLVKYTESKENFPN